MSIKLKNNLIDFYGNPAGFLKNGDFTDGKSVKFATVDSNFKCDELSQWLENQNLETTYEDGVFEKLALNRKYYEEEDATPLKNVRVWQLRQDFDVDCRFASYEEMVSRYGEPTEDSYKTVFDGELNTNDLEEIYQLLNDDKKPQKYTGHSLSMSDVVELYDDNESEFFYVDRFGFKQVDFTEEQSELEIKNI